MNTDKLSYLYNLTKEQIYLHQDYLKFSTDEYCCFHEPEPFVQTELNEYSKPIEFMGNYYLQVNKYQFIGDALAEAKNIQMNLIRTI